MEDKQIIYQSHGFNKKVIFLVIISCVLIIFCGLFFAVQKRTFYISENNRDTRMIKMEDGSDAVLVDGVVEKTKYVLAEGSQLVLALFYIILGIMLFSGIISSRRVKATLYKGYMDYTHFSLLMLLGILSSKNMKTVRVFYKDIVDIRSDISKVYISANEKQYAVFCQFPKEFEKVLKAELS